MKARYLLFCFCAKIIMEVFKLKKDKQNEPRYKSRSCFQVNIKYIINGKNELSVKNSEICLWNICINSL